MRKFLTSLLAGLAVVASAVPAMAETKTVTGKVTDLTCYVQNKKNTGADHVQTGQAGGEACAQACVKWQGMPVGLVTADGTVYQFAGGLAANNNAKAVPHLTHNVTVTGDVTSRGGALLLAADDLTMAK